MFGLEADTRRNVQVPVEVRKMVASEVGVLYLQSILILLVCLYKVLQGTNIFWILKTKNELGRKRVVYTGRGIAPTAFKRAQGWYYS